MSLSGDNCVSQLIVWPESHLVKSEGLHVMDGLTGGAMHPTAKAELRSLGGHSQSVCPRALCPG